jgi:hypothetical protein
MEQLSIDSQYDIDQVKLLNDELAEKLSDAGVDESVVLQKARDNLTIWDGYFNENITRGKDDMNFVLRDQWTAVERSEFNRLFKPAMTFNKLYDVTKKIAGEQRKNKPDLIVRSLTGRATQEQINLRADLVRTISYQSQNDLVYQTAFMQALMMGFGAFEINLDYETPLSFNQVIRYDIIPDATRTSFDPVALKPHKGDGNFCSRQYIYTKEQFYATYPHIDNPVSYTDPRSLLDFQWETRDTIVVCKYTQKEWFPLTILQLSNGMIVTEDEWEDMQKQVQMVKNLAKDAVVVGGMILKEIPEVRNTRKTQDYVINQYMLTQNQIIDFTEWPSKHLPIIFVDGDSQYIQGMQYTRSFIHEAKDAQKFINYVGSEIAAEIKNRRREQWIGTPDNILGNEQIWRNPEVQNGILLAKPDPKTGMMPQKSAPWDLSPALLTNFQRGSQDIREILGFSEQEQLQGRDISGKARRERKMEGSMSSYVWFDNMNQAVAQGGRVVLDLLPALVGEDERSFVVTKPDGRTESVIVNQRVGDDVHNILDQGDYDIEIDTGPSFAVQKEVALEMFQQTLAINPQTFPLIADLWAKNLDMQYMPQIAERFKSLVPPQIIAKEEGKQLPPQPPSPQEQMMHMQMENEKAQLMERAKELQIRQEKHELEKVELAMKAHELQEKLHAEKQKGAIELHKADLSYSTDLARIIADLHKSSAKTT